MDCSRNVMLIFAPLDDFSKNRNTNNTPELRTSSQALRPKPKSGKTVDTLQRVLERSQRPHQRLWRSTCSQQGIRMVTNSGWLGFRQFWQCDAEWIELLHCLNLGAILTECFRGSTRLRWIHEIVARNPMWRWSRIGYKMTLRLLESSWKRTHEAFRYKYISSWLKNRIYFDKLTYHNLKSLHGGYFQMRK